LEERIAIVEDAKSHEKNRRSRRQLIFRRRETRDLRSLLHRVRIEKSARSAGKERVSWTQDR